MADTLSVMPAAVLRNLSDKLYEKRKNAALEVEGIVKQLTMAGEHEKISAVINLLTTDFTYSPQENHRKGGLIGMAAATVGLTSKASQHLEIGGATSIFIKEGSIGTLLVKMPWKGSGCQVEVDELEIVLTPCKENRSTDDGESCSTSPDDNNTSANNSSRKHEHGMADSAEKPAPNSVHEGVKTIAKMVKLFLNYKL